MSRIALLIGVSEYLPGLNPLPAAVKDVEAIERVLKDPEMGNFDLVKALTNPDRQSMEDEIDSLFSERSKDDLIVLFFSGHGIKDDSGKLYFATKITCKNQKGELVRTTAMSATTVHEAMHRCRAKRQVLILDCCFSGAFDPSLTAKNDSSIDFKSQLEAEGRVVLTSSSFNEYSFEQKESELSIYTRYLVEGIETGAADLDGNGEISITELHDYVSSKIKEVLPHITPKIIVLKDEGYRISLAKTRGKLRRISNIITNKIHLGDIKLESSPKPHTSRFYNPVPSLLTYLEFFISKLSERLREHQVNKDTFGKSNNLKINYCGILLEIIRQVSDADFVFSLYRSNPQSNWTLKSQSNLSQGIDEDNYTEILRNKILSHVSVESIFTSDYHSIYRNHYDEKSATSKAFILIPLEPPNNEFIAICGLSTDSHLINDAYGRIVSSFYKAGQDFSLESCRVDAAILDDLKRNYGYLPFSLYEKRFNLFCERLSRILIYFEPIFDIDDISISGWEALARDPDYFTAPVDLFTAAELWGRKFTIQLDQHLLKTAVNSYEESLVRAQKNGTHEILPLSVNVYPESLMRTAYFNTVNEVYQGKNRNLFSAKKLILEISEKASLPMYNDGIIYQSPLESFKKRLAEYTKEFKISFGIDDFGVGHASVSRLSGLQTPYVKIDREILHHQPVDIIIQFVQQLVSMSNPLNPAKIIVEGLDDQSPVTLNRLKKLGVSYVQGYIIGRAGQDVNRLSPERRESLRKSVLGH